MADWVINALENDGYPYLVELGEPPQFDVNTLFVEPKPRNIWVLNASANDGYPFISWQFDFELTGYDFNRPYYRYQTSGSTESIIQFIAGYTHSLAINSDGNLYAWGNNFYKQIGDGTSITRLSPVAITGGDITSKTIIGVGIGERHSLAIDTNGNVYAWGNNENGKLGDGTTTERNYPKLINGGAIAGKTIVSVKGGFAFTIALDVDGNVYGWGRHLSDGTTNDSLEPILINNGAIAGKTITMISGDGGHVFAIDTDGVLYAWGNNSRGQLGDGSTTNRLEPVAITGGAIAGKTIAMISASKVDHSLAIDTDGVLYAWGFNDWGQVGDGTTGTNRLSPVAITGGDITSKTIATIGTGAFHSLAIDTDGVLYAWGRNNYGQLGDNTIIDIHEPAEITGGAIAVKTIIMANAGYHSLAFDTDGVLYGCGRNGNGRIGDGTEIDRHEYVVVISLGTIENTGSGSESEEIWRKLLRLYWYNGSTMKRAYRYRFWNGTRWV